jgi:C_GCAxxG_C_C family probable redox protein
LLTLRGNCINKYEEKARALFLSGYNCAQSVFLAFAEEVGLDIETAKKLSASFGGGKGRLKEVCGAVSGAFMAAGLFRGDYDVMDAEAKSAFYDYIHCMGDMFKAEYGSLLCRELHTEPLDEFKRPCIDYVGYMARTLADSLNK